jgi:hypothetical protein
MDQSYTGLWIGEGKAALVAHLERLEGRPFRIQRRTRGGATNLEWIRIGLKHIRAAIMIARAAKNGLAELTYDHIQERARVCREVAAETVHMLEDWGLATVEHGGKGRPNQYRFAMLEGLPGRLVLGHLFASAGGWSAGQTDSPTNPIRIEGSSKACGKQRDELSKGWQPRLLGDPAAPFMRAYTRRWQSSTVPSG